MHFISQTFLVKQSITDLIAEKSKQLDDQIEVKRYVRYSWWYHYISSAVFKLETYDLLAD